MDYLETETDVVVAIVRLPIVDIGQTTIVGITTVKTVTVPEYVLKSAQSHCDLKVLIAEFYLTK